MTADSSQEDRKVGYKQPPIHSRFPPGQSGNPRGRRNGLRNFATDAKAMLKAPVALNEGQSQTRFDPGGRLASAQGESSKR
jgi:hypothetical protein